MRSRDRRPPAAAPGKRSSARVLGWRCLRSAFPPGSASRVSRVSRASSSARTATSTARSRVRARSLPPARVPMSPRDRSASAPRTLPIRSTTTLLTPWSRPARLTRRPRRRSKSQRSLRAPPPSRRRSPWTLYDLFFFFFSVFLTAGFPGRPFAPPPRSARGRWRARDERRHSPRRRGHPAPRR